MTPHLSYHLAKSMRREDLSRADSRRLLRAARRVSPGSNRPGVIDALGHRLIAIGTRLVSDPTAQPTRRRTA